LRPELSRSAVFFLPVTFTITTRRTVSAFASSSADTSRSGRTNGFFVGGWDDFSREVKPEKCKCQYMIVLTRG
jgi:hypothetical protein